MNSGANTSGRILRRRIYSALDRLNSLPAHLVKEDDLLRELIHDRQKVGVTVKSLVDERSHNKFSDVHYYKSKLKNALDAHETYCKKSRSEQM